jgi:hypothetical protein
MLTPEQMKECVQRALGSNDEENGEADVGQKQIEGPSAASEGTPGSGSICVQHAASALGRRLVHAFGDDQSKPIDIDENPYPEGKSSLSGARIAEVKEDEEKECPSPSGFQPSSDAPLQTSGSLPRAPSHSDVPAPSVHAQSLLPQATPAPTPAPKSAPAPIPTPPVTSPAAPLPSTQPAALAHEELPPTPFPVSAPLPQQPITANPHAPRPSSSRNGAAVSNKDDGKMASHRSSSSQDGAGSDEDDSETSGKTTKRAHESTDEDDEESSRPKQSKRLRGLGANGDDPVPNSVSLFAYAVHIYIYDIRRRFSR